MASDPSLLGPPPSERDDAPAGSGSLEIRGPASGLLDDPLLLRVRGAGPEATLTWRARLRDDDGRVWRAAAALCEDLAMHWSPAKEGTGSVAALRSLRPLSIDVRVETADGRAATRTLTRRFAADGVCTRRWRDGLSATLHVPQAAPCATAIVDATPTAQQAHVATLAAPLLASRGVLVLVVSPGRGRAAAADPLTTARERLAAVPGAASQILLLSARGPLPEDAPGTPAAHDGVVVLPPGVGVREDLAAGAAAARAGAWDALLQQLGATPRERPAAR